MNPEWSAPRFAEAVVATGVTVKKPDPRDAIVPICVSLPDLADYGCPSCGYPQGVIAKAEAGCIEWICRECRKIAHAIVPGMSQSAIPAFDTEPGMKPLFPKLREHPLKGMDKAAG